MGSQLAKKRPPLHRDPTVFSVQLPAIVLLKLTVQRVRWADEPLPGALATDFLKTLGYRRFRDHGSWRHASLSVDGHPVRYPAGGDRGIVPNDRFKTTDR